MCTDDDERYARQKFGTQKGISSDEFFGKGAFDPSAQSEAKTRLQGFEGATSISSNAYFGRPEDDIPQADEYGNYGDLEGAARDFVRKFGVTAGDDLDNLSAVLGEGATKLQGIPPLNDCVNRRCEKADTGFCSQGLSAITSMDEGAVIDIAIEVSSCSKTARQRTMEISIMTGERSFASALPSVSTYAPTSYEELCHLAMFST